MTPYNIYYFTYNRCLNHFFFSQEKETLHQRKSACSLRSPNGSKGRSPPLISSWICVSRWKSLVTFPLTLWTAVKKDISSSYLFNSQKCWGFSELRKGAFMCRVRWAIIWTRSVQYITLIYIILFIKNLYIYFVYNPI